MVFKELGGVGLFPFSEKVVIGCGADGVYRVDDAWNGKLACVEDRELDGGDALVDAEVQVSIRHYTPTVSDVGGAEGVHECL